MLNKVALAAIEKSLANKRDIEIKRNKNGITILEVTKKIIYKDGPISGLDERPSGVKA